MSVTMNVRPPEEDSPEPGMNVWLMQSNAGGRFSINLSTLTLEELTAYRYVVDAAIASALPIVIERDANAQFRFSEYGDDSVPRFYQVTPTIWNRPGEYKPEPPGWVGPDGASMVREPGVRPSKPEGSGDYE